MLRLKHEAGDLIKGQYKIIDRIKTGGMGSVYKVEDIKINAYYACKEMDLVPDTESLFSRKELLEAFKREAGLAVNFKHTRTPRVTYLEDDLNQGLYSNLGMFAGVDRRCYMLLDYIEGEDLEEKIKTNNRPFSEDEVKVWLLDIADVIRSMHHMNLIHRDIKPDNIMIENSTSKAYLLDFGLTTKEKQIPSNEPITAKTNWGTRGYAPDVQAEKCSAGVFRDIYSFGMTIYRLLTNKNPKAQNEMLIIKSRRPREINPTISGGMEQIILRAICMDGEAYSNIEELIEDLLLLYSQPGAETNATREICREQQIETPSSEKVIVKQIQRILKVALQEGSLIKNGKALRYEFSRIHPDIRLDFAKIPLDLFITEVVDRYDLNKPYDVVISGSDCDIWSRLPGKHTFYPLNSIPCGMFVRKAGEHRGDMNFDGTTWDTLVHLSEEGYDISLYPVERILVSVLAPSYGANLYDESALIMNIKNEAWAYLLSLLKDILYRRKKIGGFLRRRTCTKKINIAFVDEFVSNLNNEELDSEWACYRIPCFKNMKPIVYSTHNVISICDKTPFQREAFDFAQFFVSRQESEKLCFSKDVSLINRKNICDISIKKEPPYYRQLSCIVKDGVHKFLQGRLNISETLAFIDIEGQKVLNKL